MSIVIAIVFSILLLTGTGCATSIEPPAAKQEVRKKEPPVKPAKHNEQRSMNEESLNAIQ
jgi:PBP1b-binding outer membrane lipoprotein LpoB